MPRSAFSAFLLAVLVAACAGPEAAPDLSPPEGWQGTDTRWWRDGADTSGVFRNLETLADMGVSGAEAAGGSNLGLAAPSVQQRFEWGIKESLIQLYRNEPEVVDSLFERHAAPQLDGAVSTGTLRPQIEAQQRKIYKMLRNHFREPLTKLTVGEDVGVTYPDSLRQQGIEGTVRTQVYIDAEGEPVAIELIERVHPVLDALAMRATTEMRWRPAYRLRSGSWIAIPSWSRFRVRFTAGG